MDVLKDACQHAMNESISYPTESDQSVVGTVTSLQVQEGHGEVVRVTWVGVQGATAYRVSWRRMDGRPVACLCVLEEKLLTYFH